MGLLTGGLAGRRFRIASELPTGFRDLYLEAVREHAFAHDLTVSDGEPRLGWATVFDPADTDFELNTLLIDRYIALSLRADRKVVQGAFFKIALVRRIAEVCEERGVEKLNKGEIEVIKDALEADLYRRALPSVATTDLAWDIHSGEVLVFGTSESKLEQVRVLLKETFGVSMLEERLVDWLTDKLTWDEICDRVGEFLPGTAPRKDGPVIDGRHEDDPLEGHELHLGADFLTWLWLQSEASDGLFRIIDSAGPREAALAKREEVADDEDDEWNDITESLRKSDLTVWIDHKLKLQELHHESPETTILIGQAPSATPEARHELEQGKRPVEVQIGLKLHDLECAMTVCATGEGLAIKGLKVPTVVKTGGDEKILERMFLVDLVNTTLKQLFQQFFLVRTSPAWHPRVDRFITEDLAAK